MSYPTCSQSENIVCKHVRAIKTFYVDLSFLPADITITEASADTLDGTLTIVSVSVLANDLTVDAYQGCAGAQLEANRAILITLSGGTPSDDEVIVTVNWVQSDGEEDSRECRLFITGIEGSGSA